MYPTADCVISGGKERVPDATEIHFGFPCQDAARDNNKQSNQENRNMVQQGTHRTGGVLAGIRKLQRSDFFQRVVEIARILHL